MAAGDLITTIYQIEYNGVLFGDDTVFDVSSMVGHEFPSVREADEKRPLEHGNFDLAPDLMANRVIILRCQALTDDVDILAELRTATKIREAHEEQLLPLVIRLNEDNPKRIMARCRRRDIPLDRDFALGYGNVTLMFWCPDPFFYDNTEQVAEAGIWIEGTGFDFDIEFDLSFGGSSSGGSDATCVNDGDVSVGPVVTITGPVTAPRLINQTTEEEWQSEIDLLAGEELVVDFKERTVMLDDASRYYTVTAESTWWKLRPGSNVVHLSSEAGSGSAQIVWRSAWHALV